MSEANNNAVETAEQGAEVGHPITNKLMAWERGDGEGVDAEFVNDGKQPGYADHVYAGTAGDEDQIFPLMERMGAELEAAVAESAKADAARAARLERIESKLDELLVAVRGVTAPAA